MKKTRSSSKVTVCKNRTDDEPDKGKVCPRCGRTDSTDRINDIWYSYHCDKEF